jgi:orotate phosphoribosyltransferase
LTSAEGGPDVRDELAKMVATLCHLQGEFVLRSGQTASVYFDKYMFEAEPAVLGTVARRMAALVPADTEVLAGLELGGVPVATALSLETGIPTAFVRKEAKTYGTAKVAEGSEVAGRRVLIVEDVITTGGQVVASTEQLRALGATVEAVLCVIDRSAGDHTRLESIGLKTISLFRAEDLA